MPYGGLRSSHRSRRGPSTKAFMGMFSRGLWLPWRLWTKIMVAGTPVSEKSPASCPGPLGSSNGFIPRTSVPALKSPPYLRGLVGRRGASERLEGEFDVAPAADFLASRRSSTGTRFRFSFVWLRASKVKRTSPRMMVSEWASGSVRSCPKVMTRSPPAFSIRRHNRSIAVINLAAVITASRRSWRGTAPAWS